MQVSIKDGKMTIVADVNKEILPSASGKTKIVATSHGNIQTGVQVEGKNVTVGFNAYIPV